MSAKPKPDANSINELIKAIRACFHRLGAVADGLHAEIGVTAAMRGVLESLAEGGRQTVPDIARAKTVSRQHIQVLADQLMARGLVEARPNPRHKRSMLIGLTQEGAALFADMQAAERDLLIEFAERLPPHGVTAANKTLTRLRQQLDAVLNQGDEHET